MDTRLAVAVVAGLLAVGAVVQFGPVVLSFLLQENLEETGDQLEGQLRCADVQVDVTLAGDTVTARNTGSVTVNGTLRATADGTIVNRTSLRLGPGQAGSLPAGGATAATYTVQGCPDLSFSAP